jgi:protein TonB
MLPSLPNVVEWDTPDEPKLRIDAEMLALRGPNAAARVQNREIEAPDVSVPEQAAGPIDLVASNMARPTLPLSPMSAPRARPNRSADAAAPDIRGAEPGSTQLIALSASPGPERPPEMPQGNLSARLAISPEGAKPGTPGTEPATAPNGTGPAGLSISGGRSPASTSSTAGLRVTPGTPARPVAVAPPSPSVAASRPQPSSLLDRIQPGMPPEGLLGAKRIYSMQLTMPNLASATGSWMLTFAELVTLTVPAPASTAPPELSGPTALRKVDPKYPPELRGKHVEGEVILYAVIRADGTVDSIQLVKGIDPTLDANAAEAFALWKFRPAQRQGAPVDIETVVRIPFRAVAPVY